MIEPHCISHLIIHMRMRSLVMMSIPRDRLALFCSLLLISPALADTPITLPAPPALPSARGLPPAQREEIQEQNHTIGREWLGNLSDDQRSAWYRASGTPVPGESRRLGSRNLPDGNSGYDWHASARQAGLKQAEIASLARDKVLIENIELRQSFEAYTKPPRPVFITSDSALNAFHVLFEDSFRELELRRVVALRQQLEIVLTQSREQMAGMRNAHTVAELRPGWEHAQLVVGPALRLLGTGREFFDESVRDEIDRQVEKIRAAEAVELPAWLGPAHRSLMAVDYRACRPIGFYSDSELLQNYFRAVRWLQSIPFRAERDAELTAIGLLGDATNKAHRTQTRVFFAGYDNLLGRTDDPGLGEAAYEFQNLLMGGRNAQPWNLALADKRRWLLRRFMRDDEWNKLRNTIQLPPAAAEKLASIQFRVLSAYRLPDSLALAGTAEPGRLPSGLVVATLLGSDFARRQLVGTVAEDKLAAGLKAAQDDWHPPKDPERRPRSASLYDRYLELLTTLSAAPEPDAPAFMRNEAWAAKSCLTILSGWAQLRHTFTLQAKESITYFGVVDVPPGFVEPNPAFFGRLADLVAWTADQFEAGRTFVPTAMLEAERLRATADHVEKLGFHLPSASAKNLSKLPPDRMRLYVRAVSEGEETFTEGGRGITPNMGDAEFQAFHGKLIGQLRALADDYAAGRRQTDVRHSAYRERWDVLKSVSRRLEALAHKQLRQQSWTPEEMEFIRNYGEQLGLVMGYFGNAWLTPHDDAPRWTTVASDPSTNTMLAVATGRARLIHVLYPWKGIEILCTGSVMSYYEYPAKQRLTDTEWKALLDSPAAPADPPWIAPGIAR